MAHPSLRALVLELPVAAPLEPTLYICSLCTVATLHTQKDRRVPGMQKHKSLHRWRLSNMATKGATQLELKDFRLPHPLTTCCHRRLLMLHDASCCQQYKKLQKIHVSKSL